jgi:hypothetical protein
VVMDLKDATAAEVWLTERNGTVTCRAVYEDETTDEIEVESLSLPGAEREVTGLLLSYGLSPQGLWAEQAEGEEVRPFTRRAVNP